MPSSDDFRTLTLRDYGRLVWMRAWLVAVVVVVCTLTAFLVANLQTRMYQASARLMYQPASDVSNLTGGSVVADPNVLSIQLQSVIDMIEDPTVRANALVQLRDSEAAAGVKVSAGVYVPTSSSATGSSSNLVEIKALAEAPAAAAAIANAYAAALIELRKQWEQERYKAAQEVVKNQLKLFTSAQSKLTTDYADLAQQLTYLQIAEATATGDFRVIVPATPPSSPASPKPLKSAALGLGVGLIAGIGLAFLAGRLDTRVRSHRQAADILGLSVLGRLPRISRHALRQDSLVALTEPDGHFSEALRMLRTNLDWASIDEPMSSLLVTSSLKGEGKTVTVCNLAVTLARAGKKVIVIDADLRDPQIHRVFRLRNSVGLTSVALGRVEVKDALQVFAQPETTTELPPSLLATRDSLSGSGTPADGWARNLRVLTSGPLPPDPGEVVASRRVATTLQEITALGADYVLVDTPPILSVSDSGALSASVDGLLMIVNLDRARRQTLADAREQLNALPCRKVGIVVVGERIDHEEHYHYKTS